MKIIYTAKPIEGMVELAHPPIETRVAKERLKATIEDILIPAGLVQSYGICDDRKFPFPFKIPNVMELNGFFGENPDYNQIIKEVKELFEQPKREYAEFETKMEAELASAKDEKILEMFEKFHYTPSDSRAKYEEAKRELKEIMKTLDLANANLETQFYDKIRKKLLKNLEVVDDYHIIGLIQSRAKIEVLLKEGRRKEAVEQVKSNYQDWRRKNLAHLHNTCGDASFYGGGFWIARLVCPNGEVESSKHSFGGNLPKTAEKVLDNMRMPYQVIE